MYRINLHNKQLFRREHPLQLQPELHDKMLKFVGFLSEGCICDCKGISEAHSSCPFLGVSVFRQEGGLSCLQALEFLLGGTCSPVWAVHNKEVPHPCDSLQASSEQPQTHPDLQADISLVSPESSHQWSQNVALGRAPEGCCEFL